MDALAHQGEEGRGKLRKAAASSKHTLTRRSPNGGTHVSKSHIPTSEYIGCEEQTRGSEPSQYPEEKKTNVILRVAASESRSSLNQGNVSSFGVVGSRSGVTKVQVSRRFWKELPESVIVAYAKA